MPSSARRWPVSWRRQSGELNKFCNAVRRICSKVSSATRRGPAAVLLGWRAGQRRRACPTASVCRICFACVCLQRAGNGWKSEWARRWCAALTKIKLATRKSRWRRVFALAHRRQTNKTTFEWARRRELSKRLDDVRSIQCGGRQNKRARATSVARRGQLAGASSRGERKQTCAHFK